MTWGGWSGRLLAVTLTLMLTATIDADARDQYEQQPLHRFGQQRQPELQVGCADGTVHHHHHHHHHDHDHEHDTNSIQVLKNTVHSRLKRQAENRRQRRDYIQWYGVNTASTTYQQPNRIQSYQIHSLPYFIPIWGNPRRIPVFFPAKPILFNPGYPVRNPPGVKPTTDKSPDENNTQVTIGSRINVNENGEPIWGIVEAEPPAAAAPSRKPPTPPLLHRPSLADRDSQIFNENVPNFVQPIPTVIPLPTTTTTTTPAPVRPVPTKSTSTREEPNRCVWAIISCCSPVSTQVRYSCFEQLGCPGAFWDRNPCSKEVTAAALNAAAKFYEQS